jgi:hypothetical protein
MAACALVFLFWAYFIVNSGRNNGHIGVNSDGVAPFVDRATVLRNPPAARAGLQTGDLVDVRAMRSGGRWVWRVHPAVPGYTFTIPAHRGSRAFNAIVTAERVPLPQYFVFAAAGTLWTLICCTLIAWRRSNDRNAVIIIGGLSV